LLAQSSTPPSANANPAVVKRAKDSWPNSSWCLRIWPPRIRRRKEPDGIPVWRDDKNRENFYAVAHKAMLYANWAAPYQDPLPGDRCGLRIQRCLRQLTSNAVDTRDAQSERIQTHCLRSKAS
jgi:hypothetical protein